MPTSETRELLRNRPFLVLLAARTLSMLGMAFAPVALAFGILDLPGADAGTLSLVLAAQLVPTVLFMLVGGVIADRNPRRAVMQLGVWFEAVGFGGIGVMLLTGFAPLWLICTSAAVAGLASAMVYPALTGIIPDLVGEKQRQPANSWLAMGAATARLGGLVAGGATVVWLGGGWAMVASGTIFAAAGVLLLGVPNVAGNLASSDTHPIRQLVEGWGEFTSRQWLWVVVAQYAILVMVLQAAQGVLGPVYARAELGGAAAWTAILAGEAAGAIVGVTLSMVWRPSRPILAGTLVTLPTGLPPILMGLGAPLWALIASMALLGVCFEMFGVLWLTTMQAEVPPESLSRVASYDALGSLMLGPLGLVLAGPAILAFGVQPALVGTGVVMIAITLAALSAPDVRRLRVRPSSPTTAALLTAAEETTEAL